MRLGLQPVPQPGPSNRNKAFRGTNLLASLNAPHGIFDAEQVIHNEPCNRRRFFALDFDLLDECDSFVDLPEF